MGEETRLGNTILRRENEQLIKENQRLRQTIVQRENEMRAIVDAKNKIEEEGEIEADGLMRILDDICNQLLRILNISKDINKTITDQIQGCINSIELRINRIGEDNET